MSNVCAQTPDRLLAIAADLDGVTPDVMTLIDAAHRDAAARFSVHHALITGQRDTMSILEARIADRDTWASWLEEQLRDLSDKHRELQLELRVANAEMKARLTATEERLSRIATRLDRANIGYRAMTDDQRPTTDGRQQP